MNRRRPGRQILLKADQSSQLIRASDLAWTLVRFPLPLTHSPRTGPYRTGYLGGNVSRRLARAARLHLLRPDP